jgi:putative ABC transport system permease protein
MNNFESFEVGLKGLQANKLRTFLTMLGIIFGVGAVIAMLSIGEGARQETLQQIELMGTNNVIINKAAVQLNLKQKKASFSPGLNLDDSKAIKELNPLVEYITPVREQIAVITYNANMLQSKIIGTTPDYPATFNSKVLDGSFLKSFNIDGYSNVCVIGYGIKEKLFKFENPINKKIKIGDLWFDIVGVMAPKNISSAGASGLGIRNFNEDIYLPITTMMNKIVKEETSGDVIFMGGGMSVSDDDKESAPTAKNVVDQLTLKVKDSDMLKAAAELTTRILERRHYGIKDYEIVLPEQLLEQKQKTQRIFNIVMGAIAGISLLVGGIGIMNIMLANILERTKEIGVRRAVGATKNDILNQFMYEAIIISVIGGLIGIAIGYAMTSMISKYAEWKTIISPYAVLLAFVVSVATGLIFGIYPAKKAAEKDPIEALRYE